jgi:hypothetical protein
MRQSVNSSELKAANLERYKFISSLSDQYSKNPPIVWQLELAQYIGIAFILIMMIVNLTKIYDFYEQKKLYVFAFQLNSDVSSPIAMFIVMAKTLLKID